MLSRIAYCRFGLWLRNWGRVAFCLGTLLVGGGTAEALSLSEALAEVYRSNPELLAERARLRATDETYAVAIGRSRPNIHLGASEGVVYEEVSGGTAVQNQFYSGQAPIRNYSMTVTQPLYRGGQATAQTSQALANIKAGRARLRAIEQKVILTAITDYCDLVRDTSLLLLNQNHQKLLQMRQASTQAQLVAGAATRADLAQSEAALQQAIGETAVAESNVYRTRANFLRDVGLEPGLLEPPAPLPAIVESQDAAVTEAGLHNPEVLMAQFSLQASEYEVRNALSQALPQFSIVGSAVRQEGANFSGQRENILSAMLRLTIPVYSGGVLEAQVRSRRHGVEADRNNVRLTIAKAQANARAVWNEIRAHTAALVAYEKQAAANEIALEGVQRQQVAGQRTVLDVLNAQQALLQARTRASGSQRDRIVAQYTLAQILGRATAQGLRLNVIYYDPTKNFDAVRDRWFGFDID